MARRRSSSLAALMVVALLPVGVALAAPASAAPTLTATFSESAWETGYTGQYTITNSGSSAITGWTLEFDLPSGTSVGSYWDALLTQSGTHYTFRNREYNGTVQPGSSVSFGWVASGLGTPVNCRLNGQPCDSASTPPTAPPSTSPPPTTPAPPPTNPSTIRVAPYIDVTMGKPRLQDYAQQTGQKYVTLAFALASSSGCDPKWGGTIDITEPSIIDQVRALKAAGGEVIVSSGGAMSPYLENICSSADALAAAYRKALDAVGSNYLDVDVEASIPADMVNQALAKLQQERPGFTVSYTLRVQGQDYGVDPFSEQILRSAAAHGVKVIVNPMLMNFGYTGSWGDAMVSAAEATLRQMKQIWPDKSDAELRRMLAITPMIGRNDSGMVTTQADARTLLNWAQANHIGRIAFWSVGRDNGGCPSGGVLPNCSGIPQSQYEFTSIFRAFTG